jgi:hypothetical protein
METGNLEDDNKEMEGSADVQTCIKDRPRGLQKTDELT